MNQNKDRLKRFYGLYYSPEELENSLIKWETEQEWFFRFWTLKEAFVKQNGIGVDTDLTAFSFSFDQQTDSFHITCSVPEISCWQTQLEKGQIISLCYEYTRESVQVIEEN